MKINLIILLFAGGLLASLDDGMSTAMAQGTAFAYGGSFDDGASPANGTYNLLFTLYSCPTGGTAVDSITNTAVSVTNGCFSVLLDFGPVLNGSNYWIQLAESTNGTYQFVTLEPRAPILAVPTAVYSTTAGTAASANWAASAGYATSANSVAAANITGILASSQLPATLVANNQAGVVLAGSFNGVFTGDGGGLTNVAVTALTGTLADSQLSTNVPLQNQANTFNNASNNFVGTFTGNGAGLTGLSSANFSMGSNLVTQISGGSGLLVNAVTNANGSVVASLALPGVVTNNAALPATLLHGVVMSGGTNTGGGSFNTANGVVIESINSSVPGLAMVPAGPGQVLAMDMQPTIGAVDVGFGLAHLDICNANITANPNLQGASVSWLSVGVTANTGFVGTRNSGNGVAMPLDFYVNGGPTAVCIQPNGDMAVGSYYASGGQFQIFKSSVIGNEYSGLTIAGSSKVATNTPELLVGVVTNTQGIAYIQTAELGNAFTGTLALQPSGGNVGIGLTNASAALAVAGSAVFSGNLTASNTITAASFIGNGAGLTNLSTSQFVGTIADGQLSTNVPLQNQANTFANPSNTFVGAFTGNGAGLTNVAVTVLTGTLADSQLSTNVPLQNQANTFANPSNTFVGAFTGNGSGLTNLIAASLTGSVSLGALGNAITNWGSSLVVTNPGTGKSIVITNGQVMIDGFPALTNSIHTTKPPTITNNVAGEYARVINANGDQSFTIVTWFTNAVASTAGTKIFTLTFANSYNYPPSVGYASGLSSDGTFDGTMRSTLFVWSVGTTNAILYVSSAAPGNTVCATGKYFTNYITVTGQ